MPSIVDSVKPTVGASADLQGTADEIESKVPEELRDPYDSMIVAGSKLLWGDQTHDVLVNAYIKNNIKSEKDIPAAISKGIAQLVGLVIRKSGQRPEQLAPASMIASQVLMIHVLIYLQKKKKFVITNRVLAETTHALLKAMFKLFGVSKQKFQAILAEMKKRAKNPEDQAPEGEGDVPFDENAELPPDEETPVEEQVEGNVPPPEQMPTEALPPEGMPPEALPPEQPVGV